MNNEDKKEFRFILACILCFLGGVCSLGSINFGLKEGLLYIIAGVANIAIIVLMILAEYKRYNNKSQ